FEFKSNRLVAGNNGFFSYLDPFGKKPYAYFSSYKGNNGYSPYGTSDCASLGVSPYYERTSPLTYLRPSGFQIISAGSDTIFGPGGGPWGRVAPASPATGAGSDDFANFASLRLGAGQ